VSSVLLADTSKELTDIEFERITAVGFPGIALIFALQSWFSEPKTQPWQYTYVAGLLLGIITSLVIRRTKFSKLAYYPITFYMLLAPIFLHSPTMTPWMSLGLLTFAISVYWGAIFKMRYLVPQIALLTAIQLWLIYRNLPSFTDTRDMKLLYTYFSTIYIVGIAIPLNLVRERYRLATKSVDEEIETALSKILSEMKRISRVNRQDYRNLKLHGTTLNTLLFFQNQGKLKNNKSKIEKLLAKEISELELLSKDSQNDTKIELKKIFENRTQTRVKVGSLKISGEFKTRRTQEIFIEIIREMMLNLEKHNNSTVVKISISISANDSFKLVLSDNSSYENLGSEIEKARGSISLARLLDLVNASLSVKSGLGKGLTYEVLGDPELTFTNPERLVRDLRSAALTQFAIDIVKIGIVLGIFNLLGYVFLNLKTLNFLLIASVTAIMFAYAFKYSNQKVLFALTASLPLVLFPIASINVTDYSGVSYFPTLFNLVLSACFMVTLELKGILLRWLPLLIFSIEMLWLPSVLPENSRDILAGSTPAIPLITLFAVVVLRLRKRVAEGDLFQLKTVFQDQQNVKQIENWIDEEYLELLQDLTKFSEILKDSNLSEKQIDHLLKVQIQRIRSLLICSEHIESELVRNIYSRLKSRYKRGLEARLSLNGENFFQLDEQFDFEKEFTQIAACIGEYSFDLTLLKTDRLAMDLAFKKLPKSNEIRLKRTLKNLESEVAYTFSVRK